MKDRIRGFTLLEVLVVLLIIGLIASIVVLNVFGSNHKTELRSEAFQISRSIEFARRQATIRNEIWGVRIQTHQYEFVKFDFESQSWDSAATVQQRASQLPQEYSLSIEAADDAEVMLAGDKLFEEVPEILIEPSGEITPFEIYLDYEAGTLGWYVRSDGFNAVELINQTVYDEEL